MEMGYSTFAILLAVGLCGLALSVTNAEEVAENLTETDEAEFRQGGIAQQLMSSYPSVGGGMYGNIAGYPMMASASGSNGGSYVNMLRNLYRPPSFGLTDKVKHWVKSFMNRRQYVKPYYNPSMSSLSYGVDEYGKPTMMGANSYKAISIPLRQLQKYYKPYYASTDGAGSQFVQSPTRQIPGAASANSFVSYSPGSAGASAGSGTLYASESNSAGQFTGGSSGFYGGSSDGSSSLYGAGASSLFSPSGSGSSLFASASGPGSGIFSSGGSSGLFSAGGSSGLYSPGGGSSSMFSPSEGSSSALFSSAGLAGANGGIYGSSGSPSSGLYQGSSGGSSSGLFSLGNGNSGIYTSDGSSFYSAGNGGSDYESSAAASSLLSSLNSGGNSAGYGDLFASGASPSATVYNPSSGSSSIRGHGGSNNKKQYGASSSALYMPSGERNTDSYQQKSASEPINSFNVDSTRNSQAEPSYSVSFQPAQGKSFGSSFENSGFQPVSFSSEDGFKSGNVPGFQEKSS
ncbi:uncharacterized transmembrane protein DDB_G0289901-like [Uloborus diversus]|uniref:uncharacterized transmembrane protein DDB_G0289901-like n=1 Tax=Uloborus diversus TaxID=327109 RepID=UPI0024090D82|nr:uncharacterized transmembrane protein DDB_G0289901-like [Uloborus diversus]